MIFTNTNRCPSCSFLCSSDEKSYWLYRCDKCQIKWEKEKIYIYENNEGNNWLYMIERNGKMNYFLPNGERCYEPFNIFNKDALNILLHKVNKLRVFK